MVYVIKLFAETALSLLIEDWEEACEVLQQVARENGKTLEAGRAVFVNRKGDHLLVEKGTTVGTPVEP